MSLRRDAPGFVRGRHGDTVLAGLVLGGALLVFLWTPVTSGGYYAGADILQYFAMFQVPPEGYAPKNNFIGDTVLVMFPGFRLTIEELWAGRLPLWNPYNGWGVPHLAGFQAGVFSPFSVPYYVLPFRLALVAAAFLKLFAFGLLTHLFLRRIGCGQGPALLGAIAFMFGGYNVLWLHYPLSSSVIVIPAALYCAELVLQAPPSDWTRRGLALLLFTLALAAGLLAGHPETFFFGSLLVGAWLVYRCAGHPGGWRVGGLRFAEFAGCGIVALALCAIQLLPFFEYLHASKAFADRADVSPFVLTSIRIPLQFFPDLLGTANLYGPLIPLTGVNYIESNTSYIGLTSLFLAGWAVLTALRHRSRHVAFFAAAAALWLAYAYDIFGFGRLVGVLPPLSLTMPNRSQHIWVFCIACLAALGVEELASGRVASSPRRLAGGAVVWGVAVLLASIAAALWLYRTIAAVASPADLVPPAAAAGHVGWVCLSFVIGIAGLAALAAGAGRTRARERAALAALIVSIFLQGAWLFRHFNPTIDAAYFYPWTPALRRLAGTASDQLTLFVGQARMPANANAWYHLRSVWHYDGMGIRRSDALRSRLLGAEEGDGSVAGLRVLQLLGIRYVAATTAVPFGGRVPELVREWTEGPIHLFRVPDALPRFFGVAEARPAATDDVALRAMEGGDFDPRLTVLVHETPVAPDSARRGSGSEVWVVEDTPTRIRLRAPRASPGWIVALQTHMPGWNATVNGKAVDVARANVAFSAIAVGAGENDVVLRYEPRSVRVGGAVSVATALAMAMGAAALGVARRRPRKPIAVP